MEAPTTIVLLIVIVASMVFIWYDSRKKKRKTNQSWHDAGLHHDPHPGCLGHPEGCEHMADEETRKRYEEELSDQGTDSR